MQGVNIESEHVTFCS